MTNINIITGFTNLSNTSCTPEEKLRNKKLAMFEEFVDMYIDAFGVHNCISYLMDNDFTKDELIAMHFDEEDIDIAMEDEFFDDKSFS